MEPERIKHLEFIQSIVTRMNTNSFQIKSWTVTLISAILALYASTKNVDFILLGIFPAIVFWFLDAYYLTQERRFRGLYDDVAGISGGGPIAVFSMNTAQYKEKKYGYWNVMWSRTIWTIYLLLILFLFGLFLFVKLNC
jgi:hypothetical protein